MTSSAHWQDDIDDALGGEFDGSLSGLCIMSLSFDFTRTGNGPHTSGANIKEVGQPSVNNNQQASIGPIGTLAMSSTSTGTKATMHNSGANDLQQNDVGNFFKRFKPNPEEENNRSNNQNKIVRHLQQLKNCLNTAPLTGTTNTITTLFSNVNCGNQSANAAASASSSSAAAVATTTTTTATDTNRMSPQSPDNRSTPSGSSRSSTVARSPSPAQSCSSISSNSRTSSRSQSPSDMSVHGNFNSNNQESRHNNNQSNINANGPKNNQNDNSKANDNQQVPKLSAKDGANSTIKESSFATSVFTTTGPMHFKSMHHPFSLKQIPLSPYNQFSNSSFNPDFYDKYLSHDSHQPLQTPLIGIERTQDLLSLKLPPHGPDEADSSRFHKEWSFAAESKQQDAIEQSAGFKSNTEDKNREFNLPAINNNHDSGRRKESAGTTLTGLPKGFPFNYKSNSSDKSDAISDQHEPIDLNISYDQGEYDDNGEKNSLFNESMKHFQQNACYESPSKNQSSRHNSTQGSKRQNSSSPPSNCQGQETMFGLDPGKFRFQYLLAAPVSVATKLTEDSMTYLNQNQAYEIKLENMTDVAEAKKGFMCSVINIGFHERHMQQAENELWQHWSQQHPNEKIFSVDMKLSYNVFGVESDGLNKYEFLWDSSKAAGVFIRINSISTEFTPKKHGGEKGVPFKLSIETFSYNSKTHDSFFVSASCCQIKVFKPKGAERKIRSDRDKISKRPHYEQDKYRKPCDHTIFRGCSLTSLHPMADGSIYNYRHSHGHFASKQVTNGGTPSTTNYQAANQQQDEEVEQLNSPTENQASVESRTSQLNLDSENSRQDSSNHQMQRNYLTPRAGPSKNQGDYSSVRPLSNNQYGRGQMENDNDPSCYGPPPNHHHHHHHHSNHLSSESNFNHTNESMPSNVFNPIYQNTSTRCGIPTISNSQHFGMAYYGHSLQTPMPPHVSNQPTYGVPTSSLSSLTHPSHMSHNNPSIQPPQHMSPKTTHPMYSRPLENKHLVPTTMNSNFKATGSVTSSGPNNNYQSPTDQCIENSSHDNKVNSIGVNYQETFNSALNHSFPSSNNSVPQQPSRQRSASTSLATVNSHCGSYASNPMNQSRNPDGYGGPSGAPLETIVSTNHWVHGTSNQQPSNTNFNCHSRTNHQNQHDVHAYPHSQNYDYNNSNSYNSEQSSPQKNPQSMNDSPSSCYSSRGFNRNNSYTIPHNSRQEPIDIARVNPHISVNSNCVEVVSWFTANRFGFFTKTFNNYSGSDLLRLSKTELIEICGLIDGIRLYNSLHSQPIRPRRVLYVCYKTNDVYHPIYLYVISLRELLKELSSVFKSHLLSFGGRSTHDKLKNTKGEKSASSSSTDSRSSMGTQSIETCCDEMYGQNEQYSDIIKGFEDHDLQSSPEKSHTNVSLKSPVRSPYPLRQSTSGNIDRILIDGLTSVKIVATEQVVQILEDESVWTLSLNSSRSGLIEACLSLSHSKVLPKC